MAPSAVLRRKRNKGRETNPCSVHEKKKGGSANKHLVTLFHFLVCSGCILTEILYSQNKKCLIKKVYCSKALSHMFEHLASYISIRCCEFHVNIRAPSPKTSSTANKWCSKICSCLIHNSFEPFEHFSPVGCTETNGRMHFWEHFQSIRKKHKWHIQPSLRSSKKNSLVDGNRSQISVGWWMNENCFVKRWTHALSLEAYQTVWNHCTPLALCDCLKLHMGQKTRFFARWDKVRETKGSITKGGSM